MNTFYLFFYTKCDRDLTEWDILQKNQHVSALCLTNYVMETHSLAFLHCNFLSVNIRNILIHIDISLIDVSVLL